MVPDINLINKTQVIHKLYRKTQKSLFHLSRSTVSLTQSRNRKCFGHFYPRNCLVIGTEAVVRGCWTLGGLVKSSRCQLPEVFLLFFWTREPWRESHVSIPSLPVLYVG